MKKDVIYIDIEDDITAIIQKVKSSSEKIVALVPPKGNSVLQSVVNLKLLKRAAASSSKQLVVVTSNHALTALAGGLGLYIAKNLQSKPVIPSDDSEETATDEPVEVSDESEEEVEPTSVRLDEEDDSDEVELSDAELASLEAENEEQPEKADKKSAKDSKKKPKKVPNFDSFRKKLLIGGGIALLLIVILVAVFGRGKADISVRAETTPVDVAFEANLNADATQSDPATFNLRALRQQKQQTISVSFAATGEKDVGEKATGKMKLTRTSISSTPISVPVGTKFTSGNLSFVSTSSAQLAGTSIGPGGIIQDSKTVDVQAVESGPSHNVSGRTYESSVSGIKAQGTQMSGGTSQVVKVVSQADVDKAREQLNQQDTNGVREELRQGFGDSATVLDDSFSAAITNVRSEPGVGEQANEARLTAEASYMMLGIAHSDLGSSIDAYITSQMTNKEQQRVYENNLKEARFTKVSQDGAVAVYKISTLAYYGPQFDTERLKQEVAGKKFGEARAYLQDLPGVKGVDIKLSPFWSRNLPKAERIEIKLDVDQATRG